MGDQPTITSALAFMALAADAGSAYYGGVLLIDPFGRPVEFHCSAPLRPSRAHRILYGPTLPAYLTLEVVGPALLDALRRRPAALLIDDPAQLELRKRVRYPLLAIAPDGPQDVPSVERLQCHGEHGGDRAVFLRVWQRFAEHVELSEPFERVRGALQEARGGSEAA